MFPGHNAMGMSQDNGPPAKRKPEAKPLADQFAELIADLVPTGHIYTGAQRAKFDRLYRQLSEIDERKTR